MKTLDWYITSSFLKNLGLTLFIVTTIFFVQGLIGELLDREFLSSQVLFHHTLLLPQITVQMTPPAVLLACVLTLSSFNRASELVAFYSLGISLMRICTVILTLVFMICCVSLVFQDRVLPYFFKKRTTYYWKEMKQRSDFYLDIKQDKIWYRTQNLIYNLKSFDSRTQTIYGMSVYTFDKEFNLVQVVEAKKALYTPQGWRFIDGSVTLFSKVDPFPLAQSFKEKELVISQTPKDFQEIEKEIEGLRLKELHRYIQKIKAAGADTKSYEVKLQSKMSLSFISLIMCILGIPFAVGSTRKGGFAKDFGFCLFLTFFYWLFYSIGLSLGENGTLSPWFGAWLPSAVFLALALVLLGKRKILA